jgi:hypothetical protein
MNYDWPSLTCSLIGWISYVVLSDTTGWFTISTVFSSERNQNEGVIRLSQKLLGRVGIFYVTVKATDQGKPPLKGLGQYCFSVLHNTSYRTQ